MKRYDPLKAPDPQEWLSLDEQERKRLVEKYHRIGRSRPPNMVVHAVIHTVIENQIAMGDELPVKRTLERLMTEGLDRHQAIHAIGTVLAGIIFNAVKFPSKLEGDAKKVYFDGLEKLTAQSWFEYAEE